ncbi:MAG TPA: L-histidine N(alpha)-methyltransferase [Vicinamibacterales bacterium]|nr:L-histidine N(alpha)-methyltransferase [Vicinamibacterales bacterium]
MDSRTEQPFVSLDRTSLEQFAADVRYYLSLTPRQLPSRYFYDDLGSALFEAICRLPWYTITRAEMRLLAAHGDGVFRRLPSLTRVVELGPGNGEKLRTLLEAARRQKPMDVHLIDVSPSALAIATQTIGSVGDMRVITHQATYDAGLREAFTQRTGRTLVAFLGSNIGNFDPPGAAAFLQNIRASVTNGDAVLLGVDLVKPTERLLVAYDDPLGITAAFNRNLLLRMNRDLGASIDLDEFLHRAVWNAEQGRVEMHLVARSDQTIAIPRAHVEEHLQAGETIWTESSYKYVPEQIDDLLESCGFNPTAQWIDRDDGFALTIAEAF